MKYYQRIIYLLVLFVIFITGLGANAQSLGTLTLQQTTDMALENNHLLNIKKLQVNGKSSIVKEARIKAFPTITLNSTWQYNENLASLTIPQGSLGTLPLSAQMVVPIPSSDLNYELSKHKTFNAGVILYQPITQLGKIQFGVNVSKTDVNIAQQEEFEASLQIQQAVEKLYYGLLINQKQKEEAEAKLELAKVKLHDVESAIQAGKTIRVSRSGLLANIAEEEQNLLKLRIQAEDYIVDIKNITGIAFDSLSLVVPDIFVPEMFTEEDSSVGLNNANLNIAELNHQKAKHGVSATRWSYLPDLGLVAGYTYQTGNTLYPEHNPYFGANLHWNLQDIYTNRQQVIQRNLLLAQASENLENTRREVASELEKANRKIKQAIALVNVAQKAVTYRAEELNVQQDRQVNGLNTQAELLDAKSLLAKSRADLLASQLNYRLTVLDKKILTGR